MVNIFDCYKFNKFFIYPLNLSSFALACIVVPQKSFSNQHEANVIEQVNLIARLEKIISKIWKQKNKSSTNSLMKLLIEFKSEIEAFSGEKIDLDDCLKK
jgi:hypothetical protein